MRERPGSYNYATDSNTNLLAFSFIRSNFDLQMERVIYRGEPPAIFDLLAGRVHAMVATTIGVPHVREGKLRALAVMLDSRSEQLPDVPTFEQVGLEGFSIVPWLGVVGPARLERAVVNGLSAAFLKSIARDEVKAAMGRLGFALTPGTPEKFAALIKEQSVVYETRIREARLTPE